MEQDLISKGLDRANNTIDKFVSYASSNKSKLGKDIISGVLLLLIFGLFGCFDFVNLTFRFDYLSDISYWTKTITKAIAGVCAYHIGINFSWDREIEKDYQLKEQCLKYERLNKLKDQKSFNYYIVNVLNPNEKRKAYISQINRKIYLLDRFARNKDKLLYSSEKEEDLKLKETNRYCIKRRDLENLKSDEYIDKNIDSIEVKYNYIDPIIFEMEIDGKASYKGYKVKGSVAKSKVKKTTTTLASALLISMFITSLGIGANSEQFEQQLKSFWYWLLTCCADIGVIIWKTLNGALASRNIIHSEITLPITHRNTILINYVDWCAENKVETSKAKLIFDTILKEEERVGANQ